MGQFIIYYKRIQPLKEIPLLEKWKIRKRKLNINVKLVNSTELPMVIIELQMSREEILQCNWELIHKKIVRIFQNNQLEIGTDMYSCYEPEILELLGIDILKWEDDFLQFVKEQQPFSDTIYFIRGNQRNLIPLAKELVNDCNRFVMVTILAKKIDGWEDEIYGEIEEDWEVFAKETYQEHGLMIQNVSSMPTIQENVEKPYNNHYRPIIFDFVMGDKVVWRNIPKNAIYVDFHPRRRKSMIITSNRKDVTYTTYANYLDILARNGYNILV